MADTSGNWLSNVLDTASFCFILVAIEEFGRSVASVGPTMSPRAQFGFFFGGVALSFLGKKGGKAWHGLWDWLTSKSLKEEIARLKVEIAALRPSLFDKLDAKYSGSATSPSELQKLTDRLIEAREAASARDQIIESHKRTISELREQISKPSTQAAGWLVDIAKQDAADLSNRIDYIFERMRAEPHLDLVDPYVDLRFYLLNTSVFAVTLERLEGKLTHGPHGSPPLPQQPEILKKLTMEHGFSGELVLRQWVSPAMAKELATNPSFLGTGTFALWFEFEGTPGNKGSVRKAFPDQMFHVSVNK